MTEGSERRRLWKEAMSRLALRPDARISCPTCGAEFLEVHDSPLANGRGGIERHVFCRKCGARGAALMPDGPTSLH